MPATVAMLALLLLGTAAEVQRTVYPRLLEERSSQGTLTLRIDEHLALSLTKASVAAETLRVRSFRDGAVVEKLVKGSEIEETLYEDKEKMATISLVLEPNGVKVSGFLSPTHRIQPAENDGRHTNGPMPHVLQQVELPHPLRMIMIDERKDYAGKKCNDSGLPNNVTIEVYVVSDVSHNRRFNTERDLLLYTCIFMNSVNAVFMSLECPKVKLVLVGVERSRQDYEFTFGSDKLLNDEISLHLFRVYAGKNNQEYGNPDIALLLTGRDIYESQGTTTNKRVAGIAYEGGICTADFVALAEDVPGSYSGVLEVAHELGHSMGASHDGSPPNPYIRGHPGSLRCNATGGHIMTYVDGGPLRYQFSECNKEEIRYVLRERGRRCWDVEAEKIYSVHDVYPGKLLSPEQYCRTRYREKRGIYSKTDALLGSKCILKCCGRTRQGREVCELQKMLDHMRCGNSKRCFQGVCRNMTDLLARTRKTY